MDFVTKSSVLISILSFHSFLPITPLIRQRVCYFSSFMRCLLGRFSFGPQFQFQFEEKKRSLAVGILGRRKKSIFMAGCQKSSTTTTRFSTSGIKERGLQCDCTLFLSLVSTFLTPNWAYMNLCFKKQSIRFTCTWEHFLDSGTQSISGRFVRTILSFFRIFMSFGNFLFHVASFCEVSPYLLYTGEAFSIEAHHHHHHHPLPSISSSSSESSSQSQEVFTKFAHIYTGEA